MDCFPVGLLVMSLIGCVLGSLPAPVNVFVNSSNFDHRLQWSPAPGTPPGTVYRVYKRLRGRHKWKSVRNTTMTSATMKLKYDRHYVLSVQASYNQTRSPMAGNVKFMPLTDTRIGPPSLSLVEGGNYIQINMSLLEPNSSAEAIHIHNYDVTFRITWMKLREEESPEDYRDTRENNFTLDSLQDCRDTRNNDSTLDSPQYYRDTRKNYFTLDSLQAGVQYSIQVKPMITINPNTLSSKWVCIFTSPVEPRLDPAVIRVVTAVLIVVLGLLATFMFFLYYTGFLCKVATLPRAMVMALSQGYTLTLEGTSPDPVYIASEKYKPRNNNNPMSIPVIGDRDEDEDEDEEEEEGGNNYMDRNAQFSSEESLCCDSANTQEASKPGAPGDCGSCTDRLLSEVEDAPYKGGLSHGSRDEDAANMEVSTVPEGGQTEFRDPVTGKEEEMEEVFDSSCGVNLFSVTLAALGGDKEEEEEEEKEKEHNTRHSLIDLSRLCDVEPRLLTMLQTNSQTDYQSTDDVPYRCAGYINTCRIQHEEEEEEEDDSCFDGYMAHT